MTWRQRQQQLRGGEDCGKARARARMWRRWWFGS
jgi:hypothetical protein